MIELPKFYRTGSRYEDYDRDSGWWINTRVMHLAEYCYSEAIKDIYDFREPKMEMTYHIVPLLLEHCAEIYKVDREKALNILSNFYYNNAVAMHEEWKKLGDILQGKYFVNNPKKAVPSYPNWWNELISTEQSVQK
jgi:dipeptidase